MEGKPRERKTNLFYIFYFIYFCVCVCVCVYDPSGWLVRHTGIPIQGDGRTLQFLKGSLAPIYFLLSVSSLQRAGKKERRGTKESTE